MKQNRRELVRSKIFVETFFFQSLAACDTYSDRACCGINPKELLHEATRAPPPPRCIIEGSTFIVFTKTQRIVTTVLPTELEREG